jgi:hypothetical protein
MAHQIIVGYSSDSSEFVEADDEISSTGNNDSLGLSESSHLVSLSGVGSIDTVYCQYKNEDFLIECLTCGFYFELDTFYPRVLEYLGIECTLGL